MKFLRNQIIITALAITAMLLCGLAGCSGERRYLTVGTSANFPPFEYLGGVNGTEVVGFDIDIANQIATLVEKELRIIDIEFDSLLSALNAGTVDLVIAAMAITPDRAAQADFSNPYYTATPVAIVSTIGNRYQDASDLLGATVGAQLGSYAEEVATQLTGSDNVTSYTSAVKLAQALTDRSVDAAVFDHQLATALADSMPDIKMVPLDAEDIHYGIAVMRGDGQLLASINDALSQIIDSEYYEQSIHRHFIEGL